jgi:hypothetical protein
MSTDNLAKEGTTKQSSSIWEVADISLDHVYCAETVTVL